MKSEEILGAILLTWHNIHYYQELMADLRAAIAAGSLETYQAQFAESLAEGDLPEA